MFQIIALALVSLYCTAMLAISTHGIYLEHTKKGRETEIND